MLNVEQVRFDHETKLTGTDRLPKITWEAESDRKNVMQTGYEIQIGTDSDFQKMEYETGEQEGSENFYDLTGNVILKPLTKYYVRVRIRDEKETSTWSRPAYFLTGKVGTGWTAEYISAENEADGDRSAGTYMRKRFYIDKEVGSAYACTTALGLYQFYLDGQKVGEDEFTPGWTSYHNHLLYQVYDLTGYLPRGAHTVGALVGAGWYKGLMGFLDRRNNYGTQTAFLCEIHIRYTDGTEEVIATDGSWEGADSPILFSEIYDGEIYDAGLEIPDWCGNEAEDSDQWRPVQVLPGDKSVLEAQGGCRVKIKNRIPAKEVFVTPAGDTVIDFGQNMTGWAEFSTDGKAGDRVVYSCFEVLDKDGNVYTANLRKAKQQVEYTFGKDGHVVFHPHFTFQGFRYVWIKAWPGTVTAENFTACAVHSDMEETGTFRCSNPDLNQLQHNILWGLKSNFLDVPTDCPQRNERVGWTGDAQIFSRTACYLENVYSFFRKWLKDLAADQTPEGGVPHIVPDLISGYESGDWLLSQGTHSAAAWADSAVIIPWNLYQVYGDKQILQDQYDSMKKWIGFMENHAVDYIWNYRLQFGDWVALDAEEGSYFGATPNDLTCTAYFAYSTGLMEKISRVLGRQDDAERFGALYRKIVDKYQSTFFDATGHLNVQTQTAQIVTLHFGLAPEAFRKNVVQDLLKLLEKENGHLVTGFVGTPYFCHALSDNGCLKEAYDLLLKEDFPSWLYQVKMGATTVWEHWDGIKPDGSMWSPDMNSFNHYAYGAVGEWMYRGIAGIDTDEEAPGYRHAIIRPHVGGGLTFAEGTYKSVYGQIRSFWEVSGREVTLTVHIPVNTTARICLEQAVEVTETDGIVFEKQENGYAGETGSGTWNVTFLLP